MCSSFCNSNHLAESYYSYVITLIYSSTKKAFSVRKNVSAKVAVTCHGGSMGMRGQRIPTTLVMYWMADRRVTICKDGGSAYREAYEGVVN